MPVQLSLPHTAIPALGVCSVAPRHSGHMRVLEYWQAPSAAVGLEFSFITIYLFVILINLDWRATNCTRRLRLATRPGLNAPSTENMAACLQADGTTLFQRFHANRTSLVAQLFYFLEICGDSYERFASTERAAEGHIDCIRLVY